MRSLCIEAASQLVSNCHVVLLIGGEQCQWENKGGPEVLIAEQVDTFNSRALVRLATRAMICKKNLHDSTPILLVLVHAHTIAFAVSHPCFKQTASWIHSELLRRCLLQSHPTVPFLQLHHIVMVVLRVSIRYTLALNSCVQQATAERHQLR